MKRKLTSFALALLMTVLILLSAPFTPELRLTQKANAWNGTLASVFCSSGTGTSSNPYIIPTAEYLAKLAFDVNNGSSMEGIYLQLGDDIDLTSDNSYGWTPIGTASNPFKGIFNGNNKTVSGMLIRGATIGENLGLFGVCDGATITNLTISDTEIYSSDGFVGALCGNAYGCRVSNVTVTGDLYIYSSDDDADATRFGGMFGSVGSPARIINCKVSPTGSTDITHTIKAYSYYGGFAGEIYYKAAGIFNISDCSVNNVRVVSNRVSKTSDATYSGGFFGHTSSSTTVDFVRCGISDSTVSGYRYTGGFGYDLFNNSSMKGCYVANVALVDLYNKTPSDGKMQTGGMLGYNNGTLSYSYVSLASFSVPNQSNPSYFTYGSGHNVHCVVGVNGGNGSVSEVYYVEEQRLTYALGLSLNIGAEGYTNGIGEPTMATKVNNGNLGWELYNSEGSIYWTQKDNEFIRTSSLQVTSYPLPTSSTANMIVFVSEYGEANSLTGGYCKFICTLDGSTSEATSHSTRVDLYCNAGMALVDSVEANSIKDTAKAYTWYFTRNDPSDNTVVLDVYGLEDKSFTVPAARQATYILHGETEKVFNITYADPDGAVLTPSAGAPTTFSLSNPANVVGVTAVVDYWDVAAWQYLNNATWDPVTSVTPTLAGYADITLRAKWKLKSELGSDSKTYELIYNFDNLELFGDTVNNGSRNLNAKLCPEAITYKTLTIVAGKTPLFSERTVHTDTLTVQTGGKSSAQNYLLRKALETDGYTVTTPAQFEAVITQLSGSVIGQRTLARIRSEADDQLDALGLKWGAYTPQQIGETGAGFSGVFDGNNYAIKGVTYGGELTANANGVACYGLFRYTNGATIKNLTLSGGSLNLTGTGLQVSYNVYAAPLVSVANSTVISNCTASVSINTSSLTVDTTGFTPYPKMNIGGFVGVGNGTSINDSTSSGTITLGTLSGSSQTYPLYLSVGGFLGSTTGSAVNINRCVRTQPLVSTLVSSDVLSMGGVVGWAQSSLNITDCLVMSDVTADPTSGTKASNPLYTSGFAGRAGLSASCRVSFTRCAYGGAISNFSNACHAGYSAFNGANPYNGATLYETWNCCYYDVYKNYDDLRIGSLVTSDAFTDGYMAYTLQKDYYEAGGTGIIWGQTQLGSNNPVISSSPSSVVRLVQKYSAGYYLTKGNSICDVDGNFTVNTADFTRILNGSVGKSYDNGGVNSDTEGADISGDGVVDALDVMCADLILSGNYILS